MRVDLGELDSIVHVALGDELLGDHERVNRVNELAICMHTLKAFQLFAVVWEHLLHCQQKDAQEHRS